MTAEARAGDESRTLASAFSEALQPLHAAVRERFLHVVAPRRDERDRGPTRETQGVALSLTSHETLVTRFNSRGIPMVGARHAR